MQIKGMSTSLIGSIFIVLSIYSCEMNKSSNTVATPKEISTADFSKEKLKERILALNEDFEIAMLHGATDYLEKIFADDFMFTHGDGWIKEGAYLAFEDKDQTLDAVEKKPFQYRKTAKSEIELHDDVAIVNGVYNSGMNIKGDDLNINITYVRVYANRNEEWKLLSHKTVQLIATPIVE